MFGFLKNSELVLKHKQIQKVKEMRKHMCYAREPMVITVEHMAAYMDPYSKMPVKKAVKAAKEDIRFIGRDCHID